jgi:methylglutamate dehydrogenase subunit D
MSDRASALGKSFKTGQFGNLTDGAGVALSEKFFDFTAEIAAFPDRKEAMEKIISAAAANAKSSLAYKIAASRWLAAGTADFRKGLEATLSDQDGTLTDVTHGRSAIVISGPKAEWVLSKLFAIDFSSKAFPEKSGLATMHHDTFAQIYRSGAESFEVFVFRSFARSLWHTLCRAAEEVGYEMV